MSTSTTGRALRKIEHDANSGTMFARTEQELNRYRPAARIIFAIVAGIFCVFVVLIIINFVGTFVATFQNMGNIFLLTFGGPGESTMVVGLRIWIEAYNNLRFSLATSMAWVLGAILIGFTYLQIRLLRRVEFKKADWD